MDTDQLNLIRTHDLHRVLSHVQQKFIRVIIIFDNFRRAVTNSSHLNFIHFFFQAPKCERPAYLLDVIERDIEKSKPGYFTDPNFIFDM